MRPSLRSLSAAMVVALTGCASGFDRLGPFELVIFGLSDDAVLRFEYDEQKRGCQVLDEDFSVEVNGAPAPQATPGDDSTPILSGTTCAHPSAWFRRPAVFDGQTVTITATSGGDTFVLEIEGMGLILGARAILAPGEVVHAGQVVQIAVDPGFERLRWGDIAQFTVTPGPNPWTNWVSIAPPSAAGVIDVQLPSNLPPGPAHILVGASTQPVVTRCERAGSCDFPRPTPLGVRVDVVVDIAP